MLSGSDDSTLKLWSSKGECLSTFEGHSDLVTSVSFSPDGKSILSGSYDGTMRVWDRESAKEMSRYVHQNKEWYSLDFINKTAKGTPMSWKLTTMRDKEREVFTIDKLKGFEVCGY